MLLLEKEALTKVVNNYVMALNKIGASQSNCQPEEILPLCAKNCKQVRNGRVLFEGKESFPAQLKARKDWFGAWLVNLQAILISTGNLTATIRYDLATEKEGNLIVIAMLYFDSAYLITEINEVHNKREL